MRNGSPASYNKRKHNMGRKVPAVKRIIPFLLALLLTLSACGGSGVSHPPETENRQTAREPVELYVVTSYGGNDGNRGDFEAAVKAYEASTGNIVIDGSATSNEGWKAKVLADFETGSEPDVLFFFTDADVDPIIQAQRVVSIEEIREVYPDYASNMKQSMLAQAADGNHYAVPSAGYWENLFVNKAVLQACGVEVPGVDYTWEQFLADCETIKNCGYIPIACSLYEVPHYLFEFAVMNNGNLENHLEVPALDESGVLIDNAAARKWIGALHDIKELYQRSYFPGNTLTAADAETVSLFAEGEAAFLIDGSWQVGYLTEHYSSRLSDFAVSCVPAKGERRATEAIGGISMGYFITRKAWEDPEKREAAVEFVTQLTSDEVLSTFIRTEVTALIDGARPEGLNSLEQSAADVNAQLTGVSAAVQDAISGEAKSTLFASIQKVVTGRMTPEEAVVAAIKRNQQ